VCVTLVVLLLKGMNVRVVGEEGGGGGSYTAEAGDPRGRKKRGE